MSRFLTGTLLKKRYSVLPGFGLTLGFSVLYLSLIVLIPLAGTFLKTATLSWQQFVDAVTAQRVLASLRLSFGAALLAAFINLFAGALIAWVLARYRFPGRRLLDAIVDLPFALPTAVAGIALSTLYSNKGWIGALLDPVGIKVSYTPLGVILAMSFIGLPFVVRTLQPVLEDFEREVEEAAATLGASRWQTVWRVIAPHVLPALLTGFALAFARAVGEYGSVIFIAGNIPLVSEIAPLIIITKLEQYDYAGATAVAVVMLLISFVLLFAINGLQWWAGHRHGQSAARE
ncbi:sulfate ABC transporter permease subunit CysT [Niveibacterium sp. SC-1]|uniref:sulfate ABC transporter permease subunit CysT n=1 Tax=Niveibacterium sp. SC-1 TaxID=3135646 RepID=UPI00311EF268